MCLESMSHWGRWLFLHDALFACVGNSHAAVTLWPPWTAEQVRLRSWKPQMLSVFTEGDAKSVEASIKQKVGEYVEHLNKRAVREIPALPFSRYARQQTAALRVCEKIYQRGRERAPWRSMPLLSCK